MAEIIMERVKYLPLMMAGCVLVSVSLPYIASVTLKKVHMFLPYISHAAAFPPHSAFLSIFMAIGTFFGIPTFLLRFASIDQKRRTLDPKKIKVLNTFAVTVGILAAVAMLLGSHYPIGFVTHDRYDWCINIICNSKTLVKWFTRAVALSFLIFGWKIRL